MTKVWKHGKNENASVCSERQKSSSKQMTREKLEKTQNTQLYINFTKYLKCNYCFNLSNKTSLKIA